MSKLIVEMEKVPKNCDDSCWGYLSGECPWSDHVDGYTMNGGRPRNCPIKGVLPEEHGDLIDRDALKKMKVYSPELHEYIVPVAYVDWQDTVIAAERKDDE